MTPEDVQFLTGIWSAINWTKSIINTKSTPCAGIICPLVLPLATDQSELSMSTDYGIYDKC